MCSSRMRTPHWLRGRVACLLATVYMPPVIYIHSDIAHASRLGDTCFLARGACLLAEGGGLPPGGVSASRLGRPLPLLKCGQTNMSENITFQQLGLRTVRIPVINQINPLFLNLSSLKLRVLRLIEMYFS